MKNQNKQQKETINTKDKAKIQKRKYRTINRPNSNKNLEQEKEPLDFFSLNAFFCL